MERITTALTFLVPQILELMMAAYCVDAKKAAEMLYSSELFTVLEDEKTKLWHLSAHALFELFTEEQQTGQITYPGRMGEQQSGLCSATSPVEV